MENLRGKIVVVTAIRKMPRTCSQCKCYDSMGGSPGRGNDGVCTARATLYSTQSISTTKERLDNCPLRMITGDKKASDA